MALCAAFAEAAGARVVGSKSGCLTRCSRHHGAWQAANVTTSRRHWRGGVPGQRQSAAGPHGRAHTLRAARARFRVCQSRARPAAEFAACTTRSQRLAERSHDPTRSRAALSAAARGLSGASALVQPRRFPPPPPGCLRPRLARPRLARPCRPARGGFSAPCCLPLLCSACVERSVTRAHGGRSRERAKAAPHAPATARRRGALGAFRPRALRRCRRWTLPSSAQRAQ
jgi:hypothetical protein